MIGYCHQSEIFESFLIEIPILTALPSTTSISSTSTTSVFSLSAEDSPPLLTHHIVQPESENPGPLQDESTWCGETLISSHYI